MCYNLGILLCLEADEGFVMQKIDKILTYLRQKYPHANTELVYEGNYQLLVAVILSAQCTDKRVNTVTPTLFERYPDARSMSEAKVEDIESIIKPCGFYHSKARAILSASQTIVRDYRGQVPTTIEDLITLRGVGRKTANVVYAVGMGGQAIAVDTHVKRVSYRLGLADTLDVVKIEKNLMKLIPRDRWSEAHHLLLFHGRYTCKSLRPLCDECGLKDMCRYKR